MTPVVEEIAGLEMLASDALHARWIEVAGDPVPRVSPRILRLALAWELQARACGDASRKTTQMLDQLARGSRAPVAARAMRLTREWRGRVHEVIVGDDQVVRWNGRDWGSLSAVAREITGTRWSGPAFFGLKKRVAA